MSCYPSTSNSSTCPSLPQMNSSFSPSHFFLSGASSSASSMIPSPRFPLHAPSPCHESARLLPHPHLHPFHPLNHPIHHRLPLPIQGRAVSQLHLLPLPTATMNLQMYNVQQEFLPQLMPLHPTILPSLHPVLPCAITSAFKPYLLTPQLSVNTSASQNFFYFPPTPAESNADSEDDKSQTSSELAFKFNEDLNNQLDCPKLEAQPMMSLEDEDLDEAPPILTPPPELNPEVELDNDLPSIKSESLVSSPKWDLSKPIPQKAQVIIPIEIEPTPPVTPEENEEKEERDNQKDTQSESGHSTVPSIDEMILGTIGDDKRVELDKAMVIEVEELQRESAAVKEPEDKPLTPLTKRAHSKERKSLPLKRRKPLEMTDYEGRCQWADCGFEAEGTNLLYDHVLNDHILPLRSFCSATPSTSGVSSLASREGSVVSESSTNPSNSLQASQLAIPRRRASPVVQCSDPGIDSDSDELDPLGCQWADCEMCLTRGDSDRKTINQIHKQYQWLRDHFRTRHAKGAQTYKCILEGCQARFHTNRQLEDHVRVTHIQPANASTHRKERKPGDIWKKTLRELPSDFPLGKNPYYSAYHHSQLVAMAQRMEKLGKSSFLEFRSSKTTRGSSWRKTKISSQSRQSILVEGLVQFKIPQIPIKMEIDEEKMENEGKISPNQFNQKLNALKRSKLMGMADVPLDDLLLSTKIV